MDKIELSSLILVYAVGNFSVHPYFRDFDVLKNIFVQQLFQNICIFIKKNKKTQVEELMQF